MQLDILCFRYLRARSVFFVILEVDGFQACPDKGENAQAQNMQLKMVNGREARKFYYERACAEVSLSKFQKMNLR